MDDEEAESGFSGSIFDEAKAIIEQLSRYTDELTRAEVGNIGEIIPDHPHTGYESVYACKIPLGKMDEGTGCMIAAFLMGALEHMNANGVKGLESLDVRVCVDEDERPLLRFFDIDSVKLRDFLESPPVAFKEALSKVKDYYLDNRFWHKNDEGNLGRRMEYNEGVMMEQLLGAHHIKAIEIDNVAHVPGADTQFSFIITPEALKQLQKKENYSSKSLNPFGN